MNLTTEIQQFQDEAREGWMPEKQLVPDFGEPWEYTSFRNCIRDRHNVLRQIEDDLRDRSSSCVNACAGMVDPAKEIRAMRGVISACMSAMPVGNIQTHTPENLAARIGDLAAALAAETSENEAMRDELQKVCQQRDAWSMRCDKLGITAMREAIKEAHEALEIASRSIHGATYYKTQAVLAKLQPFIP